jgi:hypothetical protein
VTGASESSGRKVSAVCPAVGPSMNGAALMIVSFLWVALSVSRREIGPTSGRSNQGREIQPFY